MLTFILPLRIPRPSMGEDEAGKKEAGSRKETPPFHGRRGFIPQDALAKRCIGLAGAAWAAALVVLLIFWTRMPAQVPLFYSKPWGQEQLAAPGLLFLPIFLSAVFFIGNLVLAKRLTSQFVSNALLVGGTTVVVLTSVTLIRIVFLVA